MMGHWASVLSALATMAAVSGTEVANLSHSRWPLGQTVEIRTDDVVYRGQLVDRRTGECRLATSADGTSFSPPRTIFLLGATSGRHARQMLVQMHEVKVGMKMELGLGDLEQKNRHVTSEVKAIKLID